MSSFFYVLLTLLFSSIVLVAIFFTAWRTMGRQKHTLIWTFAFVFSTLQWLINVIKPFDSYETYWVVACSLSIMTIVLGTWGHLERTKRKFKLSILATSGVVVALLTFYFTVIEPHSGLSNSLYLFHTVFYLCVCGYVLIKHREKPLPAEIGAAVTYFIFAVTQLAAAVAALLQGAEYNAEYFDIYRTINFLTVPSAYIAMSLFVVFVLASDMAEKMRLQAITDPLTNCLNRRGFYDSASSKLNKLTKLKQHVCVIYWDIDKFKSINDRYGHSAGDTVLKNVVDRVKKHIKSTDLLGRVGGEEFVILLGRACSDEAKEVAERLRIVIAEKPICYLEENIEVTASFGITEIIEEDIQIEQAIDKADCALYQAKETGRNKVVYS